MARKKISEYKAKSLLLEHLGLPYQGIAIVNGDLSPLLKLDTTKTYVVKVDQGIKKRFKLGLVALNIKKDEIDQVVKSFAKNGYTRCIIEPFLKHDSLDERYLSLVRIREGVRVITSVKGGVDIENEKDSLKEFTIPANSLEEIAKSIQVSTGFIKKLVESMDQYHFSFLEINPLIVNGDELMLLDLAVEVDSAGGFFVQKAWSDQDFVSAEKLTPEEEFIEELSRQSQASFKLDVLNEDGSIFMLLSGGGASIVLADEVYNQGFGKELANYGEYSGNPNSEETYYYTKQLLSMLLKSKAKKKVLIIAGGVANFTDIRVTFKGIMKAIAEASQKLQQQDTKVFVRRGGPYQKEGLASITAFLQKENLIGEVHGPELVLTEIVAQALEEIHHV